MAWDPDQYLFFADHRLRPAIDLLNRIPPIEAKTVVDLGCGSGNVLPHLAARWPAASIVGVDSSAEMLAAARAGDSAATLIQADISDWEPAAPVDVIFSNAALNWLGSHDRLLPRLVEFLKPGGVLAIQMPRNHDRPSHTAVSEAIDETPRAEYLRSLLTSPPVHPPDWYLDCLASFRTSRNAAIDIWETDYVQILEGENPVADWTRGTFLKPFLDALSGPDRTLFEEAYRRIIADAYPKLADGTTAFPFRRLFIVLHLNSE